MTKDTLKLVAAGVGAFVLLVVVGVTGYLAASKAGKRAAELEEQLAAAQQEVAAVTKFGEILSKAKADLAAAGKSLNVTLVEDVQRIELLPKGPGVKADGKVTLDLAVEYEFGFDLAADRIELAAAGKGAQLKLAAPVLAGVPAVRVKSFAFPPRAVTGDEAALAQEIAGRLAAEFEVRGRVLAENEAIRAVCEKRVLDHINAFIGKQPGLRVAPAVALVYAGG